MGGSPLSPPGFFTGCCVVAGRKAEGRGHAGRSVRLAAPGSSTVGVFLKPSDGRYDSSVSALYVFLGGGVGSVLRHGCNLLLGLHLGTGFPWATLTVNVLGSFLLALLMSWPSDAVRPEVRWVLGTGMMGGFTTYSTFNLETLRMFEKGAGGLAAAYVTATVLGCLTAGVLGMTGARLLR